MRSCAGLREPGRSTTTYTRVPLELVTLFTTQMADQKRNGGDRTDRSLLLTAAERVDVLTAHWGDTPAWMQDNYYIQSG